jgi:hypothetical protein
VIGSCIGQVVKMGMWFLLMGVEGQMIVGSVCPKQHEGLVWHVHKKLGSFWGLMDLQFILDIVLVVGDAIISLIFFFF